MKTPEEIKKGLECCDTVDCEECPYAIMLATKYEKTVIGCEETVTQDTVAYIKQLEAKIPRWIPVEERMPEENGEYLVLYRSVSYKRKKQAVVQYEVGYGFWTMTSYYEGFDQVPFEGVTHWMPLLETPEEV